MTAQPPGNLPPPPPGGYPPPPPPAGGGFQPPVGAPPQNKLIIAILATLFCLPFGIVSIIKSSQVSGLWSAGQYIEAKGAAEAAKKWAIWGLIAGVVIYVLLLVLSLAGVLTFGTESSYEY